MSAPALADRYYGNVNPDLLAAIPLDALRVLELGAGSGALGAAFKRRNPLAIWIGVELNAAAAAIAAKQIDEVIVADAESHAAALPWQGQVQLIPGQRRSLCINCISRPSELSRK